MKRLLRIGLGLGLLAGAGCLSNSVDKPTEGQAVFNTMQRAVENAAEAVAPSVVPVVVYGDKKSSETTFTRMIGGVQLMGRRQGLRHSVGIAVSKDGVIMIPGIYKPGEGNRVTVWLGTDEYQAKVLDSDERLNRTLVKISDDVKTVPLPRDKVGDLKTGGWCVAVTPSDEAKDFEKFVSLSMCRGSIEGQYRTFVVSSISRSCTGSPVVDMNGIPVGIVDGASSVLALSDMNDDLQEFIEDVLSADSDEEDEEGGKGRLGVIVHPVNKDYAKEHGLPRYALWVDFVSEGSPAAAAGIKTGDLVVGLNGKPLRFSGDRAKSYFTKMLHPEVGAKFEIEVMRGGGRKSLSGVFDKRPEEKKLLAKDVGVEVKEIRDSDVFGQNLFTSQGVLITKIESGSPAATSARFRQSLLMKGDVILELDGRPTPTLEAFTKVLEQVRLENRDVLLVAFKRGTVTGYAGLNLKIGKEKKEVSGDK